MSKVQVYTRKQQSSAVNLSAIAGWLMISLLFAQGNSDGIFGNIFGFMFWAALFGLPISFLLCWVLLAPLLRRVMSQTLSWRRAGTWGAIISGTVAFVLFCMDRYRGWRMWIDPNFSQQYGYGDTTREMNGVLTPYGWQLVAQLMLLFILAGIVSALVVRAIIGPAKAPENQADLG